MSLPSSADRTMEGSAHGALRVALLGSTGSIGRQAVEVLAANPDRFRVVALAAGRDARVLAEQAALLRPEVVSLAVGSAAGLDLPAGTAVEGGAEALVSLATRPDVDLVVVGTGGMVSLRPVIEALEAGKIVATANKETLVAAGHLVMPVARRLAAGRASANPYDPMGSPLAWLRPTDSEHPAIWQCLAVTYPDRWPSPAVPADLIAAATLTFRTPDERRFPALRICRQAGDTGSRASAALIAADEVAVARFLAGSLDFQGIPALLAAAVERF